jgi:hypothetical protein
VGIRRRIEDDGCIVVGRREVPCKYRYVLWTSVVSGGGQNQFFGQRMIAQLDPDLPVETGLPEGVMSQVIPPTSPGPKSVASVISLVEARGPPHRKKIHKGKFDAVFVAGDVDQLPDRRGRVHSCVVPRASGEESKGLPVIQEQTRLLVSLDVDAQLVGRDCKDLRGVGERQLLSTRQDILGRDGSPDLEVLEGAEVCAHLVQGIHRRGVDQVRLLGTGLLRRQHLESWCR